MLTALAAVLNVLASLVLIVLVLLHGGRVGACPTCSAEAWVRQRMGSTVMERNLDRITIVCALIWGFTVVALSLMLGLTGVRRSLSAHDPRSPRP